jgi:hypothetical protein
MGESFQNILPCPKIIPGQEELTLEQTAYARQFARTRISVMLSTVAVDEQQVEEHLWQAYRTVGCQPPQIRWFNSPIAFVLAHFPLGLMGKIRKKTRTSLSASVWEHVQVSSLASTGSSMLWYRLPPTWLFTKDTMRYHLAMSEWRDIDDTARPSITENAWRSAEVNISNFIEHTLRDINHQVQCAVWNSLPGTEDRIWKNMDEIVQRVVCNSINICANAYASQHLLALAHFFSEVFEPNTSIHLARLNEMVSAYRLGSKEAWLVRKPILLERDERAQEQNGDSFIIQYSDNWGCRSKC